MNETAVDWDMVEGALLRSGWVMGWGAGLLAAAATLASGRSADLAGVLAGIALAGFVFLGRITGLLLGRFASQPSGVSRQPSGVSGQGTGTLVDHVVGDEPEEAEADEPVIPRAEPEESVAGVTDSSPSAQNDNPGQQEREAA